MKKTKAQPSVTKADEKNTNGKNIRNSVETAPSDIRVKDSGESVPEFKRCFTATMPTRLTPT